MRPFVYATVGTDHHRFDRLVEALDEWARRRQAEGRPVDVVVQYGTSRAPQVVDGIDYQPFDDVCAHLRRADAVVCHGGPATMVDCRAAGRKPIVVPRQAALGEHVDDHQVAFARRMAAADQIALVLDTAGLGQVLDTALEEPAAFRVDAADGDAAAAVDRFGRTVEELVGRRPVRERAPVDAVDVVYVGGFGRSGSTLLDRVLGQVDGYVSVGEVVHLWQRGVRGGERCGCGEAFAECPFWRKVGERAFGGWDRVDVDAVLALQGAVDRHRYIPLLLAPWVVPAFNRRLRAYADLLGRLYAAVAEVSGARVVVDSSKHASTAFLLRRVPGVRLHLVHLVRDSRGVAHSWAKRVRKPEVSDRQAHMPVLSPGRSAVQWLGFNLLLSVLRAGGGRSSVVRYEALAARPRTEFTRLLADLPAAAPGPAAAAADGTGPFVDDDAVVLAADHTVAGNPMRFATGRLQIRADDAWRRDMPAGRRLLVTTLTWPLLAAYGYGRRPAGGPGR